MDQTSQTRSLAISSIETFRSDRSIPLTKSGRMRGRAMMLLARTLWRAVLLSATTLLLPAPASAQGYPVRLIKLVVPVELLKIEAKIDVVHVPYRGAAPAVNDLLDGHIDM